MLVLALALALDPAAAERFASLALACAGREYPNKIAHVLQSDEDVHPPRTLTPAFFGCFDWHSSVHGHWLLVRLARQFPGAPLAANARALLDAHLTPENIRQESDYLLGKGRESFERPYGLAWLLQLSAELREWDNPDARRWSAALQPLERAAISRLSTWLPKLSHPERTGVHSQTAFSLGLLHDSSDHDPEFRRLVASRIRDYYLKDRSCPISYEPSGQDFLSPCLAEADAMRRILAPAEFASWFDQFLPRIPLQPEKVTDPADGQLAHLDGLNLSRAWMLAGIAAGLPPRHPRRAAILKLAAAHRDAGLQSVTGEHYEGGHWLASFAVYLTTRRGLN